MADDVASKIVKREEEDYLSGLPDQLKDVIMEKLTLDEAVRMSCLSKSWIGCWKKIQTVHFDANFCLKYFIQMNIQFAVIISSIVAHLNGPIKESSISVPYQMSDETIDVTEWIRIVSRNGIQKLVISANTMEYIRMPSHIYSCLDLEWLDIACCTFEQAQVFEGFRFRKLTYLRMSDIKVNAELLSSIVSGATELDYLHLIFHHDGDKNVMDHPKLSQLHYECKYCDRPIDLKRLPNVKIASLKTKVEMDVPHTGVLKLEQLVHLLPKVEELTLDGAALSSMSVVGDPVPKKLANNFCNLRELYLGPFDIASKHLLSVSLCLIRSAHHLQTLEFSVDDEPEHDYDKKAALEFLESQLDGESIKIPVVKFDKLIGTKFEISFIKKMIEHCNGPLILWVSCQEYIKRKREVWLFREVMKQVKCPKIVKIEFDPIHVNSLDRAFPLSAPHK